MTVQTKLLVWIRKKNTLVPSIRKQKDNAEKGFCKWNYFFSCDVSLKNYSFINPSTRVILIVMNWRATQVNGWVLLSLTDEVWFKHVLSMCQWFCPGLQGLRVFMHVWAGGELFTIPWQREFQKQPAKRCYIVRSSSCYVIGQVTHSPIQYRSNTEASPPSLLHVGQCVTAGLYIYMPFLHTICQPFFWDGQSELDSLCSNVKESSLPPLPCCWWAI